MATYTKEYLSESANGRPIKVAEIVTPGTLIHTVISGEVNTHEVFLWASNTNADSVIVVLEWGGTTDPDDHIITVIPPNMTSLLAPGLILQNSLNIRCFASVADVITVFGFVNKIEP